MMSSKHSDEPQSNRLVQASAGLLKASGSVKRSLGELAMSLGLSGLVCGISFPSSAQQVIRDETGQASEHVVVNFRGLAAMEQIYGLGTNITHRVVHAPFPLAQYTNPPPARGGGPP